MKRFNLDLMQTKRKPAVEPALLGRRARREDNRAMRADSLIREKGTIFVVLVVGGAGFERLPPSEHGTFPLARSGTIWPI
jgi:hypothetical protein